MSKAFVFARDDTMFGVCAGIGEDFGFSPTLLRLLFSLTLFWNPIAAVAGYALGAVAVALSRWLVPEPLMPEVETSEAAALGEDLQEQAQAWEELALAA